MQLNIKQLKLTTALIPFGDATNKANTNTDLSYIITNSILTSGRFQFKSASLIGSPASLVLENDGSRLYFTNNSLTRNGLAFLSDITGGDKPKQNDTIGKVVNTAGISSKIPNDNKGAIIKDPTLGTSINATKSGSFVFRSSGSWTVDAEKNKYYLALNSGGLGFSQVVKVLYNATNYLITEPKVTISLATISEYINPSLVPEYNCFVNSSTFVDAFFDGNNVWVLDDNTSNTFLYKINSETGNIQTVDHAQTSKTYTTGLLVGENVWFLPRSSTNLLIVNPRTNAITTKSTSSVIAGSVNTGCFDGKNVWVPGLSNTNVFRMLKFDMNGTLVSTITQASRNGFTVYGILSTYSQPNKLYIVLTDSTVIKIDSYDTSTNTWSLNLFSFTLTSGSTIYGTAWDGYNWWILHDAGGTNGTGLTYFRPSTSSGSQYYSWTNTGTLQGITWSGEYLYITNNVGDNVSPYYELWQFDPNWLTTTINPYDNKCNIQKTIQPGQAKIISTDKNLFILEKSMLTKYYLPKAGAFRENLYRDQNSVMFSKGIKFNDTYVNADYNIRPTDNYIVRNAGNLTLPIISSSADDLRLSFIIIKNEGTDNCTLNGNSTFINNQSSIIIHPGSTCFLFADFLNPGGVKYQATIVGMGTIQSGESFGLIDSISTVNEPFGLGRFDFIANQTPSNVMPVATALASMVFKDTESTATDTLVKSNNITAWIELCDQPTQKTGTISTTSGSKNVTGSGTSFTSEVSVGQIIFLGDVSRKVTNVIDNTHLQVDAPFNTTGSNLYYISNNLEYAYSLNYKALGTISGANPRYLNLTDTKSFENLINANVTYSIRIVAQKSAATGPIILDSFKVNINF